MTKYCCDCKWIELEKWQGTDLSKCNAPQNMEVNLVSGVQEHKFPAFAEVQRNNDWLYSFLAGRCGRSGKWFTPK